jgi:RHS repeat-associated protein
VEHGPEGLEAVPYRFTGKELDEETGLYYYGARYLNPRTSRWVSADPELQKYLPERPVDEEARKRNQNLPGQGGVFNLVNLAVYQYGVNNPVKYFDPAGSIILDIEKSRNWVMQNTKWASTTLGPKTIGEIGCFLVAAARVIGQIADKNILPSQAELLAYAEKSTGNLNLEAATKALSGKGKLQWMRVSDPSAIKGTLETLEKSEKKYFVLGMARISVRGKKETHWVNIMGFGEESGLEIMGTSGHDPERQYDVGVESKRGTYRLEQILYVEVPE